MRRIIAGGGTVLPAVAIGLLVLLAVMVLTAGIASAQDYPKYTILRTTQKIVIDGLLDEAGWAAAPSFGPFKFPWYESGAKEQTDARMLWDDEFLYVSFTCEDAHIWADHYDFNTATCLDDCAELFWDPNPADSSLTFNQFEINCIGNALSLYYNFGSGSTMPRFTIMAPHTAQVIKGTVNNDSDVDEGWTLELAIRFADYPELSPKPFPIAGDTWKAGLHRCGGKIDAQYSQWSPSRTERPNYHRPQDFGTLIFSGQKVR